MDEVIADALVEHLARYNRDYPAGPQQPLTIENLHGRYLWDAVPADRVASLERYLLSDDFFRVLPVMPHAQRVLERLQSRYDIFIATAAMEVPSSFTAKFDWLAEHFPFIPSSNIVFCGNKSILRADFLIDDNPRQLRLFESDNPSDGSSRPEIATQEDVSSRPEARSLRRSGETPAVASTGESKPREGILFTSPANINVTGFRRVDTWLDVEALFLD
jgi:5'(3')-deoxyribonucleotidase